MHYEKNVIHRDLAIKVKSEIWIDFDFDHYIGERLKLGMGNGGLFAEIAIRAKP